MVEVRKRNLHYTDFWADDGLPVYNVTEYSRDHPGGPDALLEVAGTDATSAYEDVSSRHVRQEEFPLTPSVWKS